MFHKRKSSIPKTKTPTNIKNYKTQNLNPETIKATTAQKMKKMIDFKLDLVSLAFVEEDEVGILTRFDFWVL
jgi:hypothetical protein